MRKFLLSSGVIVVFGLYALHIHSGDEASASVIAPNTLNSPPGGPTSTELSTPVVGSTPPVPTATAVSNGRYKNGTYTGDVTDAFYGNVQVQVTISGGKITDVQFLQYPNDRSTSVYINQQAMPYLKREAIQAQSANVAGVSGASATSQAFIESLQSALNKAI